MTLLTTINIVLGAVGGGSEHFWGEKFPPKWPVCNTAQRSVVLLQGLDPNKPVHNKPICQKSW